MKLGIIGSCVSRDILPHDDQGSFELDFYLARSSIGSMFAAEPFEDVFSSKLKSSFQQRMVHADITKRCESLLRDATPDLILLDLIDERFDLFEVAGGGRCTLSTELLSAGFLGEVEGTRVRSGTSPFMARWRAGWKTLIAILDSRGLRNRLVINKVYWQAAADDGSSFEKSAVSAANATLRAMYGTMKRDLPLDQFIDYNGTLSCPAAHKWKPSPFHYSDANMKFALEKLRSYCSLA